MASSSSIQLANQSAWQQFKLSMAERNADQAEQQARTLRSQADAAQRDANRAQEHARTLQVDASQAESTAGQARRGVASVLSAQAMVSGLSATYDRLAQVRTAPAKPADMGTAVNSQGQVTGQVVSVAA